MPTYLVELSNDTETYRREIEATTPEEALQKAGLPYDGFYPTFQQVTATK